MAFSAPGGDSPETAELGQVHDASKLGVFYNVAHRIDTPRLTDRQPVARRCPVACTRSALASFSFAFLGSALMRSMR